MKEKDFYSSVKKWATKNLTQTAVIELKLVKTKRFRISEIRSHQIRALKEAKHNSVVYKIPDAGMDQKPFDICFWSKSQAFLAVIFYEPRIKKNLYLIDIDSLDIEKVSYTEEEISLLSQHRASLS